jgi:D-beta-D-heptose 7-phosphate kinase / D-beta-D-heptose 1-phosphate adenosyltransferase
MGRVTIVFTNGCFDLFHVGHLKLLKKAKELGDELHVGINSDRSISNLKGPDRPIIPQDQRFEILAAIKYVDRVYIFDEQTPINLIEQIMPDIVVKGGDWKPQDIVGGNLAKVVIIPLLSGISTSKIIDDIKNLNNIYRFLNHS